jgi:HK97 family phage prohead protease
MSSPAFIEGYASLFNVADGGGDTVLPGAFVKSLARRGPAGVKFLFQHDPAQPIGRWRQVRETRKGLFVRGEINLDVARGQELASLVASGAIDGLSIGFRTVAAARGRVRGQRLLREIDLWEISLVTFPMLAGARVTGLIRPGATAASTDPGAMTAAGLAAARMTRAAALMDMSNPTRN